MLKQIHLIVNDEELNTICQALRCVKYWHQDCIEKKFSPDSHKEMIEKEQILLEEIEERK